MPILAAILGAIMIVGGILPRVANNMVTQQLRQVLMNPRKLETRLVQVPSYGLLSGAVERLEVDAEGFQVQGVPVESLWIAITPIKMSGSKMYSGQVELEQASQAEAKLVITQKNMEDFLQTDRMKDLLGNIKLPESALPIPIPEGALSIEEPSIQLKQDRVIISGRLKAFGGFIDMVIKIASSFELTSENELVLRNVEAEVNGTPVQPEQLQPLTDKLNPLLDLRKFATEDMKFFFRKLLLEDGRLTLVGAADIRRLPKF